MFFKNILALFLSCLFSILLSLTLNIFPKLASPAWLLSLLIMFVCSVIFNLVYAFNSKKKDYAQLLLACIVIKMLVALITVVVYSSLDKPGFFPFAMHFIGHYVLFTIFEIRYLLFILKKRQLTNDIHKH